LSGHAILFEKYRVHKLVYRFKNLKGSATDGNILMSFDFDTLDDPPQNALEVTQSTVYTDGAPWRVFEMSIPMTGSVLYTRTDVPLSADLKTYDLGRLHVSAEACADTSVHGYIEVDYDIEFLMKQSSRSQTQSAVLFDAEHTNATFNYERVLPSAPLNIRSNLANFGEEEKKSNGFVNVGQPPANPLSIMYSAPTLGADAHPHWKPSPGDPGYADRYTQLLTPGWYRLSGAFFGIVVIPEGAQTIVRTHLRKTRKSDGTAVRIDLGAQTVFTSIKQAITSPQPYDIITMPAGTFRVDDDVEEFLYEVYYLLYQSATGIDLLYADHTIEYVAPL
jgi:hypothetical protein